MPVIQGNADADAHFLFTLRQLDIFGHAGDDLLSCSAGDLQVVRVLDKHDELVPAETPGDLPVHELAVKEAAELVNDTVADVVPGGIVFADSTLIEREPARNDIKVLRVPATALASENGIPTLANMIIMGKLLSVTGTYNAESVEAALGKVISAKHADMLDLNRKALEIGAEFK